MWEYIEERVRSHAEYIIQTGCTVRACAEHFGNSKSTVHKDLTERLQEVDQELYGLAREVLDHNLRERHIRGGNATREKYNHLKEIKGE